MTTPVLWIYVCASLLLIAGLLKILSELPREHGPDKALLFSRLAYAIPMTVFGSEHFTLTANIAALVPRWIPAHVFWTYLVGTGFVCAGLAITVLVQARLGAALVGATFFIFVCVMDVPGVFRNPGNRFAWALALRQLAFSGGAFAFAMSRWSTRARTPFPPPPAPAWASFPRFFVGIPALFYGMEDLLHPAYVPGIPLNKLAPEWIPGRVGLGYLVGMALILGGAFVLLNRKARTAALGLGLVLLLSMLWVYLPMLVAAPMDLVAQNYFFDSLLFCGTVLVLANAVE